MQNSPEYHTWSLMRQRCYNRNCLRYPSHGGRGIGVCASWRVSFSAFYADMGKKPTLEHTLDRINNDGNYEPGNCRWATPREQANNTRRNLWYEHNGEKRTLAEWSRISGIPYGALKCRLMMFHWPIDKALTQPVRVTRQFANDKLS